MFFDYQWIKDYLPQAPSLAEAARILNETGLETEVDGNGLEIEHTVNRPDAMSHFGVARELAVKLGTKPTSPAVYAGELPPLQGWTITSYDALECPQYTGLKLDGVVAAPSPPWLKEKLAAIDQTSHNLLVDLTNFLLWEYGHPSHAFDAEKIEGRQIHVRPGAKGERLTTLDGRDHSAAELLCITDRQGPIAFGGVMGGLESEVTENTTSLLLELACFRGSSVRRTGRNCNILSDARHRFERGVDRENMEQVMRRFIYLLQREQPSITVAGFLDMDLAPFKRAEVVLRRAQLDRLLGIHIEDETVTTLLSSMNCGWSAIDHGWQVSVPGYKVDVTREVDLIEEIIRFAGLDLLKSDLPAFQGIDFKADPIRDSTADIRNLLTGTGYQETCTYSFLPEPWDLAFASGGEPLRLRNPMSENQAVMRRHILPGLLDSVRRNLNRGIADLAFFEIGHTFHGGTEPHHLAVVITQGKERDTWWQTAHAHPFYIIKGVFELLRHQLGWSGLTTEGAAPAYFQAGESLGIRQEGNLIGGFGTLAKTTLTALDRAQLEISAPLAVMELDLSFLLKTPAPFPDVRELPIYPGIQQDLAFVLDTEHSYQTVENHLRTLDLPHLESLSLFDVYAGKSVGQNKKSLGFRFRFQADDRTLTGEEIAQSMSRAIRSVEEKFGATVRV